MAIFKNRLVPTIGESQTAVNMFMILVLLLTEHVIAYDDLRGKVCMAQKLELPAIPKDQVEYDGEISLELECDDGYDFPLNFNQASTTTIVCRGNNRWEPDFLPDCNKRILPSKAVVTVVVDLGVKKCDQKVLSSLEVCNKDQLKRYGCVILPSSHLECDSEKHYRGNVDIQIALQHIDPPFENLKKDMVNEIEGRLGALQKMLNPQVNTVVVCPPGSSYQLTPMGKRCRGCPIGEKLESGKCVSCPHGYYQDNAMQTSCKMCPSLVGFKDRKVWSKVERVSRNRLYHVLRCPIVFIRNGTLFVLPAPDDFGNPLDKNDKTRAGSDPSKESDPSGASAVTEIILIPATVAALSFIQLYHKC